MDIFLYTLSDEIRFFGFSAHFSHVRHVLVKLNIIFFAFHQKCAEIHRKVQILATISRFFSYTKIYANTHRMKKNEQKIFFDFFRIFFRFFFDFFFDFFSKFFRIFFRFFFSIILVVMIRRLFWPNAGKGAVHLLCQKIKCFSGPSPPSSGQILCQNFRKNFGKKIRKKIEKKSKKKSKKNSKKFRKKSRKKKSQKKSKKIEKIQETIEKSSEKNNGKKSAARTTKSSVLKL